MSTEHYDDGIEEETTTVLEPTTPAEARTAVAILRADAKRLSSITTQEQADALGLYLSEKIQPAIKRIKEIFVEPERKASATLDAITTARRALIDPLEAIKRDGKDALADFAQRAAIEARKREQALVEQALAVAEEIRESEAAALDAAGEPEAAQQVREMEPTTHVPVAAATASAAPPKVRGVAMKSAWVVDVTSVRDFCRGIADGTIPEAVFKLDEATANRIATAAKGKVDWPGASVRETTRVRTR